MTVPEGKVREGGRVWIEDDLLMLYDGPGVQDGHAALTPGQLADVVRFAITQGFLPGFVESR